MTLAVVNAWTMFAGYVVMKPSMDLSKTEKVICNFTNTEIFYCRLSVSQGSLLDFYTLFMLFIDYSIVYFSGLPFLVNAGYRL